MNIDPKIEPWLRVLLDGGENSNQDAETTATAAYAAPALVKALEDAVKIIHEHVPVDALGIDGEGDFSEPSGHLTRCWPILDEHLHYMDAALALSRGEAP